MLLLNRSARRSGLTPVLEQLFLNNRCLTPNWRRAQSGCGVLAAMTWLMPWRR